MQQWKKNTVIFLGSQSLSLFGSSLVQYAITWHITLTTQSGVMMTISILCSTLPTVILSPFAGVWADRYDRKKLIMVSDSMIAITTLLLAILFFNGHRMIWLLFVASSVRALGSAVQMPAVGAYLPQIVPTEHLMKVNGINGSIQATVMLMSPILSGLLLTLSDIVTIFMIDVITALLAVSVLGFFLRAPSHRRAQEDERITYFQDMKKGIVYIKQHDFLKQFFLFEAVFLVLVGPAAFLTPLQVTRSFGVDVWRLTAIEITFSIGMILGGLLMASWGGFKNKVHTMAASSIIIGIGTVALGLIPIFWLYLLCMTLVGISMPIFNTPATVLLQEKVEENYMGRVFGVMAMIASTMMPLGMLLFGPLSDIIRIEWLLVATGLLMAAEGYFMLKNQALVDAGKPAE